MKKLKGLFVVLTALVMMLVASGCDSCSGGTKGDDEETPGTQQDTITLSDVTLDYSAAHTTYFLNEDFSYDGLKVYAVKHNDTKDSYLDAEEVSLTDASLSIDSSAYNKSAYGDYSIKVKYSWGGTEKSASYTVSVVDRAGLYVEKTTTEYTLTEESGIDIALSDLSVYNATSFGKGTEVTSANYQVNVYDSNQQEVTVANGAFHVTDGGVYQIWVSTSTYTKGAFTLIYVSNDVKTIAFNAEATGVSVTQQVGSDVMSSTWSYVVTYSNGATKTLSSENVKIEGLATNEVTESGVATVSYTEKNVYGNDVTVSTTVNYTVTAAPVQEGNVTYSVSYVANATTQTFDVSWADGNEDAVTPVTMTSTLLAEKFATKEKSTQDGTVTYSDRAEIKAVSDNKYVTLAINEKAVDVNITVYVSHTSKAERTLVLASDTTMTNIIDSKTMGTDTTAPANLETVVGTSLTGGTYYIYSDGTNGTTLHLYAIVVTYTIPAESADEGTEHSYSFSYDELKSTILASLQATDSTVTAVADKTALKNEYFNSTANSFITLVSDTASSSNQYRSSNNCFEIKDGALTVTFNGTGKIAITFSSTSGSNTSNFGLKDSTGNYVVALADETTATAVTEGDDAGAYTVTGTTGVTVVYEITEAGTYTLCSPSGVTKRGCRITAITMTDKY